MDSNAKSFLDWLISFFTRFPPAHVGGYSGGNGGGSSVPSYIDDEDENGESLDDWNRTSYSHLTPSSAHHA